MYLIRYICYDLYMPKIDEIQGITIHVYSGDHRPPHIHAKYNEFEVLLKIEDGVVYAGSLPIKQMKLANAWLLEHSTWALNVFFELNPELQ